MVACTLAGFSEANIAIAQSALADVAPEDQGSRLFGYVYLSSNLAYVVGPLLDGLPAAGDGSAGAARIRPPRAAGGPLRRSRQSGQVSLTRRTASALAATRIATAVAAASGFQRLSVNVSPPT